MFTTSPKSFYTPEEYLALEADTPIKHEYFNGEIFEMPGGSGAHNQIARNLFGRLYIALEGRDCKPHNARTRLKVEATGFHTYPDISIACKPLHYEAVGSETLLNPRVLIEVLSESTEDHDRGFKLTHYRKLPSLQEIIYFSQVEPLADYYVRQANDQWLLGSIVGLDAMVEFTSIGCRIPMSQIYEGVEFGEAAT